ncbi:hypothetical protein [Pedobacter sp. R20-19]|uniref:hypothetical protein n=1 Tax=Pedobacter sp. R20-19 TaxID=1270196 RepID=UPI00049353F2|nr:hypothetical protein [Pedobacter sp. R20-19]
MGKTLITVIITIISTITILFIGYVFKYHQKFAFKYEIDVVAAIIGLLTLIVTALLAYWVSSIIETARDLNQNEREIILSRITDFSKHVDTMLEVLYSNNIPLIKVTSSIKQCNLMNTSILFLITESRTIETNTRYQTTIFSKINDIKDLMTSYPAYPSISPGQIEPVQVQVGNYVYTDVRIIEIEQLLSAVKDELAKYQLFVIQS